MPKCIEEKTARMIFDSELPALIFGLNSWQVAGSPKKQTDYKPNKMKHKTEKKCRIFQVEGEQIALHSVKVYTQFCRKTTFVENLRTSKCKIS